MNKLADITFGTTDYTLPITGDIRMGTNGAVAYTGAFAGAGLGVAGQVELVDSISTVLEVSCEDGELAHSGGSTMTMETTVVVGTAQTGAWGSTPLCTGLGNTVITHTIESGSAANTLYAGARLVPGSMSDGSFSTTNSGGVPVKIRVIVQ